MTIDERLQYLVKSTESLHASCHELYEIVHKQAEAQALHEERWERLRRALRAALDAWENNNGDGE